MHYTNVFHLGTIMTVSITSIVSEDYNYSVYCIINFSTIVVLGCLHSVSVMCKMCLKCKLLAQYKTQPILGKNS